MNYIRAVLTSLSLIIFGIAFALGASEILVRILGVAPDFAPLEVHTKWGAFTESSDARLGYVPRPGSFEVNADGYRDRLYARDATPGTKRIAVIGDSIAWGWYRWGLLPAVQTFPKVLERSLAQRAQGRRDSQPAEVLNMSVSGYDTLKEAVWLETKVLAYNPDIVVIAYCLNDDHDSSVEMENLLQDSSWGKHQQIVLNGLHFLMRYSHLVRFVWERAGVLARDQTPSVAIDRVHAGFDAIQKLAEQQHFSVVLMVFPVFGEMKPSGYSKEPVHESLAQQARERNFIFLDLLPVYQEALPRHFHELEFEQPDYYHPNAFGHKIAAQALQEVLISNKLLQ